MAGFTSVAATAIQALGAVNTVLGAVNSYKNNSGQRAYEQQKEVYDLQNQQAQQRAVLEKQQIDQQTAQAETERRAALRRLMAKQRAAYGAEGISTGDGSAEALLLGYFDESDQGRQQRESLDNLKKAAIDQNLNDQQRLNMLQLTQIKEKNKINRLTSAYTLADTLLPKEKQSAIL